MQRTVKGLKVTVAQAMIVENGEVKTNVFEEFEQLYFLDDDTFFKYAVPVED